MNNTTAALYSFVTSWNPESASSSTRQSCIFSCIVLDSPVVLYTGWKSSALFHLAPKSHISFGACMTVNRLLHILIQIITVFQSSVLRRYSDSPVDGIYRLIPAFQKWCHHLSKQYMVTWGLIQRIRSVQHHHPTPAFQGFTMAWACCIVLEEKMSYCGHSRCRWHRQTATYRMALLHNILWYQAQAPNWWRTQLTSLL